MSYNTVGERTFRAVVNYSSGGAGFSNPVPVKWVSLARVAYSPDMPALNRTVVLRVNGTGAPSGTTYQWQQTNSSGSWVNLGIASSSRSRSVSFPTKGTRKFRVVVSYRIGSATVTDTSSSVYVTWGEQDLVNDLLSDLDAAVFESPTNNGSRAVTGNGAFATSERSFLTCVNVGRSASDRFASFPDVLSEYDGAVATKVDRCESRSTNPTNVFSAYSGAVDAELKRLKSSNTLYRDYLKTGRGIQLTQGLGSAAKLKLFGSVNALEVAAPSSGGSSSVPGVVRHQPMRLVSIVSV